MSRHKLARECCWLPQGRLCLTEGRPRTIPSTRSAAIVILFRPGLMVGEAFYYDS
jgi:hypothetical protein